MSTENNQSASTPMMIQYQSIKDQYKDCLLFFRMGDFYELFYEDAVVTSKELGIVLTKRAGVQMCGIPFHAYEPYIARLIKAGHRVAICEQTETPEEAKKLRGHKATVNREVVRVITKGTLLESSFLDGASNNFLLSVSRVSKDNKLSVGYIDVSTSTFIVEDVEKDDLLSTIAKINPSEIICFDSFLCNINILNSIENYKSILHTIPDFKISDIDYKSEISRFYKIHTIDSIGNFSSQMLEAVYAIIQYLKSVYTSDDIIIPLPKIHNSSEFMQIDAFTRRSLELTESFLGDKESTLLGVIYKTSTPQGFRMLSSWLKQPLISIEKIKQRQNFVEFFVNNDDLLAEIRERLKLIGDIERSLARVVLDKAGPRDVNTLRNSLKNSKILWETTLYKYQNMQPLQLYMTELDSLVEELDSAMNDDVPYLTRDGNFIRDGYDSELDEYRNIITNGSDLITILQKRYISETGINTLKIKSNNMFGYFIDVSPNHVSKMPYSFIHKQTLASSVRYTTPELTEMSNKIYTSQSDSLKREYVLFCDLCEKIKIFKDRIKVIANRISFIDAVCSFADLAIHNDYTKPIVDDSGLIDIKNGRHPVVERSILNAQRTFVANNCFLDGQASCLSIVSGPNMGGKSTYLRQNAIIIIMAQIGSFVPASSAHIGVADKIFSRVGAFDDISNGRSTFMVEMVETANILINATSKSFVILDEIGRGTSTYDGLAIAWSVVEEIHDNIKARTLFATHYHELSEIQKTSPNVKFLNLDVKEIDNKIVFMHKVKEGFASKSYGIQVGELAGIPKRVIERAKVLLKGFHS